MIFCRKVFDGELNFALRLAREMGDPTGAPCLPGMTSTEYADWHRFTARIIFRIPAGYAFSGLTYAVLSLF